MATFHTVITQGQSVDLLGTTKVQDVMEIGAQTKPSGVFFQFRLTINAWKAGGALALGEKYGEQIEYILGSAIVFGMSYVQDVNLAGDLVDMMDIVVGIFGGDATTVVAQPLKQLDWAIVGPKLIAAENELDNVQNQ